MTRLIDVASGSPVATGGEAVDVAAARLEEGAILIHPTSTVYGIGGRPEPEIDAEVARLKGRGADRPLISVAAETAELCRAFPGLVWTAGATRLAERFWPGPLTLVLALADDPAGEGRAVRVDGEPTLTRMLRRAGGAMTSTSLNRTGAPPARTGTEARRVASSLGDFRRSIFLLDAGDLEPASPSTIVRCRGGEGEILREGGISREDVLDTLGDESERALS